MYIIKFSDGTFLSNIQNNGELKTRDISKAYKYINEYSISKIVKSSVNRNETIFKGAVILDLKSRKEIKINIYEKVIYNAIVTKETDKAYLVNDMFWIPKSQMEIDDEKKCIRISNMILKNRFNNAFTEDIYIEELIDLVKKAI